MNNNLRAINNSAPSTNRAALSLDRSYAQASSDCFLLNMDVRAQGLTGFSFDPGLRVLMHANLKLPVSDAQKYLPKHQSDA